MVVNTGYSACTPMFTWAVLFVGLWLTASINADSAVVIHAQRETIETAIPGVVRRQGVSLENCADACAKEVEISCKYFKYLNDSRTCLLSATDNPRLNRLASEVSGTEVLPVRSGTRSVASWINELEEKISDLQDQESDIENLKSAVNDIRDELKMLRRGRISEAHRSRAAKEAQQQAYAQLTRKIVGLKVDGEKFKAAVHALSNMQRVLAKEIGGLKDEQKDILLKVSELEKATGDLNTLTASLKATDSALQRELDSIRDGTNDLATKFSKLRDRINQEIANKQMPPGMVKLKHNQGALATALESMTDKVTSLMSRLPFLEKELRGTNEKVSNQAMYERELQSKLKVLYKNLIEIKKSVHNLLDPRSAVNMERAKGVLKLKSDVSMLAEMDKGLKNELQDQREDMARLVKDVARVQLMAQNLKDKLTLVLTASRQFQQDIANLKEGQKNGLSVVEVAQMQKQVLVALNRLKTREAILMKQLNKYRSSVKKVADQVAKSTDKKTRTQHVVIQLQHRLNRFEKQMQLLFDKTKALSLRMKQPKSVQGMSKIMRSQAHTNAKVMDLLKQMQAIRKRLSLLNVDLQETKKEAEDEKKEMIEEVKERQKEMKQRQKELQQEAVAGHKIDEKAMKMQKNRIEKEKKAEKQRLSRKLKEEKHKAAHEHKLAAKLKKQNMKLQAKARAAEEKAAAARVTAERTAKETAEEYRGTKRVKESSTKNGKESRPSKEEKKESGQIKETVQVSSEIVVSDNSKEAVQALKAVEKAAKRKNRIDQFAKAPTKKAKGGQKGKGKSGKAKSFGGEKGKDIGGEKAKGFEGEKAKGFGGGRAKGFGGGKAKGFGGGRTKGFKGGRAKGFGGGNAAKKEGKAKGGKHKGKGGGGGSAPETGAMQSEIDIKEITPGANGLQTIMETKVKETFGGGGGAAAAPAKKGGGKGKGGGGGGRGNAQKRPGPQRRKKQVRKREAAEDLETAAAA